jgi:hypothetical protein
VASASSRTGSLNNQQQSTAITLPASSERVFGPAMAGHANAGALRIQAGSGCMQLFFQLRRNTRDIRMTGRTPMASP